MRVLRAGVVGFLLISLTGCAGARAAQTQEMQTQIARLEGRVRAMEQQTGLVESKAWNQREDVAYLRGRVEGLQAGVGAPPGAPVSGGRPSKKQIQSALKSAGYYRGPIDGKIGPSTKQAIREFQRHHGLVPDGKVGSNTWTRLSSFLSAQ